MASRPSDPTRSGEDISKTLFTQAIHGRWDKVEEIYKNNPLVHSSKITKSGDSALHLAVLDDKEEVVKKLVGLVVASNPNERDYIGGVLGVQNDRGDTALHCAASLGNAVMCCAIATTYPKLVGVRNKEGETPLFVAALNGKKEAFLCLHSLIPEGKGLSYCRRADGDTCLHCALDGDYFDLAFQIIHRYRELGNIVTKQGYSPLHLLASKPSAFKSGSRFGIIDNIIYHCTFVSKLEVQDHRGTSICRYSTAQAENKRTTKFPENYVTCVDFYNLLRNMFKSLFFWKKKKSEERTDIESQEETNSSFSCERNAYLDRSVENTNFVASAPPIKKNQLFSSNYDVIFNFLKLALKAILIILGVGYRKIQELRETKEKHAWSVQIMQELIMESSEYQYQDNGQIPENFLLDRATETVPYDIEGSDYWEDVDQSFEMVKEVDGGGETSKKRTRSSSSNLDKKETPLLIAARSGITEMVEEILQQFPLAMNDTDIDKKNVVLLAVENRQLGVYRVLQRVLKCNDEVFRRVDIAGNSALHLAATLQVHHTWLVPGPALQMHVEYMWYEFVKSSQPLYFFPKYNRRRQTPDYLFKESHKDLVTAATTWMTNTAQACSVVAVLVAAMAYTTSTTVPGGFEGAGGDSGAPVLRKRHVFDVFVISGLVAFISSMTSLVMFFPVFTSSNHVTDFRRAVPTKLVVGLTLLFLSLTAIMISFSAADSFMVVKDDRKYLKFPIFAAACLPIVLVSNQFPIYLRILSPLATTNSFANLS